MAASAQTAPKKSGTASPNRSRTLGRGPARRWHECLSFDGLGSPTSSKGAATQTSPRNALSSVLCTRSTSFRSRIRTWVKTGPGSPRTFERWHVASPRSHRDLVAKHIQARRSVGQSAEDARDSVFGVSIRFWPGQGGGQHATGKRAGGQRATYWPKVQWTDQIRWISFSNRRRCWR